MTVAQPRLAHAELAGERVRLVPLEAGHAEAAFPLLHGNEEILRWLMWEGPADLDELRANYSSWRRWTEEGDVYRFAILERETGAFAGTISSRFEGHPETGDLGYWLAEDFWGRGMMSEAVRLANHLCFRHLAAGTMTAQVFVGNTGSRRVLEQNHFLMVHLARGKVTKRGQPIDEWLFALLRHEYERHEADYRPLVETVELV